MFEQNRRKNPACFGTRESPTFIHLALTNVPENLESTCVLETQL